MASEVSSEINQNQGGEEETRLDLPPGFRFHPTDEEVVSHYLTHKALNSSFSCLVIADVDLNKIEPWDLPSKHTAASAPSRALSLLAKLAPWVRLIPSPSLDRSIRERRN
jgi:hypothetical protein